MATPEAKLKEAMMDHYKKLGYTATAAKQEASKVGKLAIWKANNSFNRAGPSKYLDTAIDEGSSSVDDNLEAMKDFFGQE